MNTPILETERMILRPLSVADAKNIYERWTSDARVAKHVRWETHRSVADTEEWLKLVEAGFSSDKAFQWGFVLKENGYLFGCGGMDYDEEEGAFELGYNIMHKYWNRGYTTEAARTIIEFAAKELKQKEMIARHVVANPASGAVMKKCGFVYEKNDWCTKFDGVTVMETMNYRLKL